MYRIFANELTDDQMEAEMQNHFHQMHVRLDKFARPGRTNKISFYDEDNAHIERHSVQDMINDYIKWFNKSIDDYGNGFESDWDDDGVLSILYKDGSIRIVSIDSDDGTKKIKTDGIDSIIYSAGWGDAYAGPHVKIYNYRESVAYQPEDKWGYKSVSARYNDDDSLRLDFDI